MTDDLFGKLKYRERDEQWVGYGRLPLFAAVAARPRAEASEEDAKKMIADMNAALEDMRGLMRERFGDQIDSAFAEIDREAAKAIERAEQGADEPPSEEEQERERKRAARQAKRAARLAKGDFPVRIPADPGDEPSAPQVASLRFLLENEAAVFDAVMGQVFDSFQAFYADERWRMVTGLKPAESVAELAGRFAVTRLDVAGPSRGGFSHLVFTIDSEWQDEHGVLVVYSPDRRTAAWSSLDIIDDLLESDDPDDQDEEFVPTPHDDLLEAILTGDEDRARELVAAGADINAIAEDEYPPLWIAVDQLEPDEVRLLLAFGADPNLANPDEGTTPLKHARKQYRELGFDPKKKPKDAGLTGFLDALGNEVGEVRAEMKQKMDDIIRMLEEAAQK